MAFAYDDEQREYMSAVSDVLGRHCPMTFVRAVGDGTASRDELWSHLAALGLPAMLVPARLGGIDLTMVEVAAVLEAAGRFATPVALTMTTAAFPTAVLAAAGGDDSAGAALEELLGGAPCTLAPTLACASLGYRSTAVLDGHVLTARCAAIPDAAHARVIAIPAARPTGEPALVIGSLASLGVRVHAATDETSPVGTLNGDAVDVRDALVIAGDASPAMTVAWTAVAAELVGLAAELLDRAVAHARDRVQFGRPIGTFQAIKHRLVDTLVAVERARSLTRYAALALADGRPDRRRAAHRAKASASEAASAAARAAVQVHGGAGITAENDVSLLYLRARQLSLLLGGPDEHYGCRCLAM